jgi:hypothetical protein
MTPYMLLITLAFTRIYKIWRFNHRYWKEASENPTEMRSSSLPSSDYEGIVFIVLIFSTNILCHYWIEYGYSDSPYLCRDLSCFIHRMTDVKRERAVQQHSGDGKVLLVTWSRQPIPPVHLRCMTYFIHKLSLGFWRCKMSTKETLLSSDQRTTSWKEDRLIQEWTSHSYQPSR